MLKRLSNRKIKNKLRNIENISFLIINNSPIESSQCDGTRNLYNKVGNLISIFRKKLRLKKVDSLGSGSLLITERILKYLEMCRQGSKPGCRQIKLQKGDVIKRKSKFG